MATTSWSSSYTKKTHGSLGSQISEHRTHYQTHQQCNEHCHLKSSEHLQKRFLMKVRKVFAEFTKKKVESRHSFMKVLQKSYFKTMTWRVLQISCKKLISGKRMLSNGRLNVRKKRKKRHCFTIIYSQNERHINQSKHCQA